MIERLFKLDLPEDIIQSILINYDGRFKKRNGKWMFQIKYSKLYNNIFCKLSCHYGNILNSNMIRNEIFISCLQNDNLQNIQNIVRKYVKLLNLQYLYN